MKAVLLAGGEGTRLRPVSAQCPKPMVRLFDKPVMEHGIELLRKHGFTDIAVTLQAMPHKITDYFADGSAFGVKLTYSTEKKPLGTAGGVRAAAGGASAPVLVLSGDAVTDFDLTAAMAWHTRAGADATLLLYKTEKPLEYGLVMTDGEDRITRFVEKPGWAQVFSDTVNTGVYILSPAALELIPPEIPCDFARDLFPLMLERGMRLMGYRAEGYWCDIGDGAALLNCFCDVLDGKIKLALPPQSPPPPGVRVSAPCWIGEGVSFGKDASIGPYAVIGSGSRIGDGASVEAGVVDGATLEAGAKCEGAFICRGAVLREGAVAREGALVGEDALIGAHAELLESARVWPRREVEPGARVSGSISHGAVRRSAVFDGGGCLRGQLHVDLPPEFCLRLGAAAAIVSGGETALSWQGGEAARLCCQAIETGILTAGGRPVLTDALFPACAAFAGHMYNIPLSVFVRQHGSSLTIHFFGRDGLPPDRELERRIEAAALRGDMPIADPQSIRPSRRTVGLSELYSQTASAPPAWASRSFSAVPAGVAGGGPAADTLRRAVQAAGGTGGGPTFFIDDDGQTLSAVLESGKVIGPARLLGVIMSAEAAGGAAEIALPYGAPAVLDEIASKLGARVLRPGRDGERARKALSDQPWMRDPIYGAARIIHGMRAMRATLEKLARRLPPFYLSTSDIGIEGDRGEIMRELAAAAPGAELFEGMRARTPSGWVHIAPLPGRRALRVTAEGASEEIAEEICVEFAQKARLLDTAQK